MTHLLLLLFHTKMQLDIGFTNIHMSYADVVYYITILPYNNLTLYRFFVLNWHVLDRFIVIWIRCSNNVYNVYINQFLLLFFLSCFVFNVTTLQCILCFIFFFSFWVRHFFLLLNFILFSHINSGLKLKSLLSSCFKARLAFCKFMVKPSTLLVLDEPTNHLDIPSKEMLEVWFLFSYL